MVDTGVTPASEGKHRKEEEIEEGLEEKEGEEEEEEWKENREPKEKSAPKHYKTGGHKEFWMEVYTLP